MPKTLQKLGYRGIIAVLPHNVDGLYDCVWATQAVWQAKVLKRTANSQRKFFHCLAVQKFV